jgi:hypothetical protein
MAACLVFSRMACAQANAVDFLRDYYKGEADFGEMEFRLSKPMALSQADGLTFSAGDAHVPGDPEASAVVLVQNHSDTAYCVRSKVHFEGAGLSSFHQQAIAYLVEPGSSRPVATVQTSTGGYTVRAVGAHWSPRDDVATGRCVGNEPDHLQAWLEEPRLVNFGVYQEMLDQDEENRLIDYLQHVK